MSGRGLLLKLQENNLSARGFPEGVLLGPKPEAQFIATVPVGRRVLVITDETEPWLAVEGVVIEGPTKHNKMVVQSDDGSILWFTGTTPCYSE